VARGDRLCLALTAPSVQAFVDEQAERMLAIHEAANEDPGAFRITSRYVVATAAAG
jgi:hypothetical protein